MTTPIPAMEKLRAIERELGFRRTVYPRRVAENKMTQKQADWQLAVMMAIRDDYIALVKQEQLI
jgi:hypothetical protein